MAGIQQHRPPGARARSDTSAISQAFEEAGPTREREREIERERDRDREREGQTDRERERGGMHPFPPVCQWGVTYVIGCSLVDLAVSE